jgi:hypothetical protein
MRNSLTKTEREELLRSAEKKLTGRRLNQAIALDSADAEAVDRLGQTHLALLAVQAILGATLPHPQ